MNSKGEILIAPTFASVATNYERDLARVLTVQGKNRRYSVYNTRGQQLLPANYTQVYLPNRGERYVLASDESRWWIFDRTGKVIDTPEIAKDVKVHSGPLTSSGQLNNRNNAIVVRTNGGLLSGKAEGLYAPENSFYLKPQFDSVFAQSKSKAFVGYKAGRATLIDIERKKTFGTQYQGFDFIHNTLVGITRVNDKGDALLDVIDRSAKQVLGGYDFIQPLPGNRAIIRKDGQFSIVEVPVHERLDDAENMLPSTSPSSKLFAFSNGDKVGYINDQAEIVIPAKFDYAARNPSFGLFRVSDDRNAGNGGGAISETGEVVIPFKFDYCCLNVSERRFDVYKGDKAGFYSATGEAVTDIKYAEVYGYFQGYAEVSIEGRWGIIDFDGKEIIPPAYVSIENQGGLFSVNYDTDFGDYHHHYLDSSGGVIVKATRVCDVEVLVDGQGDVIWAPSTVEPSQLASCE